MLFRSLREGLHDALGRYHASGSVSEEDTRLALEVLRSYGSLRAETDVMRCKIYSLLLSAYKLLGDEEEFLSLIHILKELVKEKTEEGVLIGAICAGPMVLGGLGLLKGKRDVYKRQSMR